MTAERLAELTEVARELALFTDRLRNALRPETDEDDHARGGPTGDPTSSRTASQPEVG